MLAILSLLPAAFLVGETSKQVQAGKEGIELVGQLEEVARDVRYNAERLNSFTRDAHISRWTHYHHLEQIKGLVNDELRPALDRLTEIQPEMPEWKQHGIDRMLASANALAADTNSAILAKNEGGATPPMLNAEYRQLIARIMEHSEALVKTSDAMGTYAAAHQKALDAGLKVTQ